MLNEREFVPGRPEEWDDFLRRNRAFLERFDVLKAAINLAFTRTVKSDQPIDFVVFYFGRVCAEDFLEILNLCANGYGIGAMKLLRGMYERAVVARYLHLNPDETDAFLDWEIVSRGKAAKLVRETFGDALPPERLEELKNAEVEAKPLRERFRVTDCEKCGTKKLNHTWGPDFVSMAKKAGAIGDWLYPAYYEPLSQAHATHGAIRLRLKGSEDKGWSFDGGAQREDADRVLLLAHLIMLHVLELQRDHFKLEALDKPLEECAQAYREIWDVPDSAEPTR